MRKTAHYRRADHVVGEECTLQQALGHCQDHYPNDADAFPVFGFKNGVDCYVARHSQIDGRDFIHLVTFERGAGAAVIETLQRAGVNEEPAPEAKQFIQSQVFMLCSHNDIIWTSHNQPLRDSAISVLINQLIDTFGGFNQAPSYMLLATLDENRLRALMREGIEEIDLNVGGYRETLEYLINNGQIERAGIFSVLRSLGTNDVSQEEREAAEKINARLTLKPGRNWENLHVKELLSHMASDVLEADLDDGFAIVTKSGLRITRDTVRVKDDFNVDGNRRVVDPVQIKTGLDAAFAEFRRMGVLER